MHKKSKALTLLFMSMFFASFFALEVSARDNNGCCLNGYKKWRLPRLLETTSFFKDCWCNDREGVSLATCSCPAEQ